MSTAELPRLLAILLVIFDDTQGGKVAFQVPEGTVSADNHNNAGAGSFTPPSFESAPPPPPLPPGSSLISAAAHAHRNAAYSSASAAAQAGPLFHLSPVLQYLMPRRPVVKHLVTICVDHCKIIGFPVWVSGQHYPRGHFIYNVCFAFEQDADLTAYEPVVRKTGRILRHMEETTRLLSDESNKLHLYSILEQIYEDLGSYSETSIVLDAANTLDLKLYPSRPNPLTVRDWDIPVPMISLDELKDPSWDITMYALVKYINGARSVKRIANLADVDLPLARECIQHLLYYGCIILHDLFQYTNSYALVGGLNSLASMTSDGDFSRSVQAECESYVSLHTPVTPFGILYKHYARLRPGLSLRDWIEKHNVDTHAIDVRRFISFGIIKGFLRRIQVYPVWLDHPSFREAEQAREDALSQNTRGRTHAPRNELHHSSSRSAEAATIVTPKPTPEVSPHQRTMLTRNVRDETPRPAVPGAAGSGVARKDQHYENLIEQLHRKEYPATLPALLDGEHSADELCIRYRISYGQLLVYLRKIGHVDPNGFMDEFQRRALSTANSRERVADAEGDSKREAPFDLGRVQLILT